MFAEFDESDYPIVRVTFNGKIRDFYDFENFIFKWEEYYQRRKPFYFLFDTRKMRVTGFKYCYRMARFIKRIKQQDTQYLQRSIILVKNRWTKFLLWFIFKLQKPVAPVYITNNIDTFEGLHYNLEAGIKAPPTVEIILP